MPLNPFEHHRPTSLQEALALLDTHSGDVSPIAGGTELLVALKAKVLQYGHLVDIKRIAEMQGVRLEADGGLRIGALCSHHQLATHELLRSEIPAYAELSNKVANIRVRVAGTIGGNLCFAEPHADPPALLSALQAQVCLAGPDGERMLPVSEFIQSEFETARAENELLVAIRIPPRPPGARFKYMSYGHLERPAVGVAAGLMMQGGAPRYRIWVGAICGAPTRLNEMEAALQGVDPAQLQDVLPAAAERAAANLPAHGDIHGSADYKQHLASVYLKRVLLSVAQGKA